MVARSRGDAAMVLRIKACARARDAARGTELYAEAARKGWIARSARMGNALVHMYAECGALAKARDVLDELPVRSVVSWTALIAGHARSGPRRASLGCLEEMRCEGIRPNAATFACVLKACGSLGAAENGREIHSQLARLGVPGAPGDADDAVVASALVGMYAKCGAMEEAREVFGRLRHPNVVAWTSLMSGYVGIGHGEEALGCYEQMRGKGLAPDAVTLSCLLTACASSGALAAGEELHAEIRRARDRRLLEKDVVLANALVDMYAKLGAPRKARQAFDACGVRDAVTWNALISGCGGAGEALACLERMRCEALAPDAVTLSRALKACGASRRLRKGAEVHAAMLATEGLLSSNGGGAVAGSAVAEMYAGCGELARALQALDRLPARDAVAWNALIAACCAHGRADQALACFQKMQHDAVAPDAVTFLSVLKASGSLGAVGIGKDVHFRIVAAGFAAEADVVMGTALADMYARCGLLRSAREVFDRIGARNAASWNALIAGYARMGDPPRAVELWHAMSRDGVGSTPATFAALLAACGSGGLIDRAQTYFRHMSSRYGLVPGLHHYTRVIDLLGGAGRFADLAALIEQAPASSAGLLRRLPACSALLNACRRSGHLELASLAFGHAVLVAPPP